MVPSSVDIPRSYQTQFVKLLSSNEDIDAYEDLVRTIFSELGIRSYKIFLYDYRQRDREWIVVRLDRDLTSHTSFYHYDQELAARVSIPSIYQPAYRNYESIVRAILEVVYLKELKTQKIDVSLLKKDLHLAAKMQRLLIPKKLYSNERFYASGIYHPHQQVGGDFYDVYAINDHEVGFCIGDISGKGVNAAIVMANFQALMKTILASENSLEPVIKKINQKMYELTEGEKFLTLFIGVYNQNDRRLVYVNCGHLPIAFYNQTEFEWLEKGTTIIGAFEKLPEIEVGEIILQGPTNLLLYTDGILNLNFDDEPFLSFPELKKVLLEDCKDKTPDQVIEYFQQGIHMIDVEEELKDDISMLAIQLK